MERLARIGRRGQRLPTSRIKAWQAWGAVIIALVASCAASGKEESVSSGGLMRAAIVDREDLSRVVDSIEAADASAVEVWITDGALSSYMPDSVRELLRALDMKGVDYERELGAPVLSYGGDPRIVLILLRPVPIGIVPPLAWEVPMALLWEAGIPSLYLVGTDLDLLISELDVVRAREVLAGLEEGRDIIFN